MAEIAKGVQTATVQPASSSKIRGPISKFSEVLDTVNLSSGGPENTANISTGWAC
jgi:hypothetical protein